MENVEEPPVGAQVVALAARAAHGHPSGGLSRRWAEDRAELAQQRDEYKVEEELECPTRQKAAVAMAVTG